MEHVVSLNGLSADLRLPKEWLREQALAGRIPCLRIGRKLLFNKEAVQKSLGDMAASSREVPHA